MNNVLFRYGTCLCLVLAMLCIHPVARAASLYDYPDVAVLPYANKAAVSKELSLADASLVSEFVIEKFLDSERFNVMERDVLMEIMQEHAFNMSGMADPSTVAQAGRIAGVQYFVVGSVVGLSTKVSGAGYSSGVGGAGFNKNTVIANVTARIVDVETGRVVLAASGMGESASTNAEFRLRGHRETRYMLGAPDEHKITIGTQQFSQVQVRNALYKAVNDLVFNKDFGIVAKLDGKKKLRKV